MADFLNNLIERGNGALPSIGVRPLSRYESPAPPEDAKPQDEENKLDSIGDKHITSIKQQKNQTQQPNMQTEGSKERTAIETIVETEPPVTEYRNEPEGRTLEATPKTNVPRNSEKSTEATIIHNHTLIEETVITPQASSDPQQETINSEQKDVRIQTTLPTIQPIPKETVAEFTVNDQPKKFNESATETLEQSTITPADITVISPSYEDHTQAPPTIPASGPMQTTAQPNNEPTINVTIGRIEVRATQPEKKQTLHSTPKAKTPVMPLSEYLKKRAQGDT